MQGNPFAPTQSYEAPSFGGEGYASQQPLSGGGPIQMPKLQTGVMLFHVLFKGLALIVYLTSGIILSDSYVLTFVIVNLLSAMDFWTVKNVSGRLLVGLRWWNKIDESGQSQWQFESFEDQRFVHPMESNFFWLTLFVTPGIWVLFAFSAVITLRFMWLLLILVAFSCNMMNVVGYTKCKKDARKKLSALGGSLAVRGLEMWAGSGGNPLAAMRGMAGGGSSSSGIAPASGA